MRDETTSSSPSKNGTVDDGTVPVSPVLVPLPRPEPAARLSHQSFFPPIAEYAFLSDCETVALVAPSGAVEWMCLPRVDSPERVRRDARPRRRLTSGSARTGCSVPAARRYLPGTMVLETSWGTGKGWIIVRDVLLIGNWHHEHDRSHTHRRAPTDYDADHVLLRTVRCVNGEVAAAARLRAEVRLRPRAGAVATTPATATTRASPRSPDGSVELKLTHRPAARLRGLARDRPPPDEGGRDRLLRAVLVRARRRPQDIDEAYDRLVWTAHHWQHWLDRGDFPDHPWRHVPAALAR